MTSFFFFIRICLFGFCHCFPLRLSRSCTTQRMMEQSVETKPSPRQEEGSTGLERAGARFSRLGSGRGQAQDALLLSSACTCAGVSVLPRRAAAVAWCSGDGGGSRERRVCSHLAHKLVSAQVLSLLGNDGPGGLGEAGLG